MPDKTKRFLGHLLVKDTTVDMWSNADDSSGVRVTLNKHVDDSWSISAMLTLGGPTFSGSGSTEGAARDNLIMNLRKAKKILAYFDEVSDHARRV